MGPGVDPHGYRQTRSDIVAMTRADLVLWHGLYLEAQMERFFEELGCKRTVVAAAEALPKDSLLSHPSYNGRYDTHVWMDPTTWQGVVSEIAAALTKARPEHAEHFAQNAEQYLAKLSELATYAADTLNKVPQDKRVLVTAHDAFGYFGRTFGFEVIGMPRINRQ